MTDVASSSSTGHPISSRSANDESNGDEREGEAAEGENAPEKASIAWKRRGKEKRLDLMEHLLNEMDVIILAQLAVVYYMDCSFLRFVLRGAVQVVYLMPKPAMFPEPQNPQPYIYTIFGINFLCVLSHMLFKRPAGNEATRGYLHGGALIDLIGTEGPTSKFHLFLLDVLILLLQLVMLCVHVKRKALKKDLSPKVSSEASEATNDTAPESSGNRDIDAEERGVMPDRRGSTSSSESNADDTAVTETDSLVASGNRPESHTSSTPSHSNIELLSSGQAVIGHFHLLRTIRTQFWVFQNHQASVSTADAGTSSSARQLAVGFLGQRVGLAASLRARAEGSGG